MSSTCGSPPLVLAMTTFEKWLHFGIYFSLTIFGLIINSLLIWTVIKIIRNKSVANDSAVYIFVVSHSTSACVYLFCNVLIMLPCMSIGCEFYPSMVLKCLTSLNTIGYYATLFFVCLMTIERFLIFFQPDFHRILLKFPFLVLILPWILSLIIVLVMSLLGCYKKFNPSTFQYITICEGDCNGVIRGTLSQALFILGQAAPGLMLFLYALIITKVFLLRSQHKTVNRQTIKNFVLALQFIIICIFQWFSAFFFFMVPFVYGTTLTGVLVTNLAGMLNPSINAIVMFSANAKVHEEIPFSNPLKKKKRAIMKSPMMTKSGGELLHVKRQSLFPNS